MFLMDVVVLVPVGEQIAGVGIAMEGGNV